MTETPTGVMRAVEDSQHLVTALLHSLVQKKPIRADELSLIVSTTLRKLAEAIQAQGIAYLALDPASRQARIEYLQAACSLHENDALRRKLLEDRIARVKRSILPEAEFWGREDILAGNSRLLADAGAVNGSYKTLAGALDLSVNGLIAVPVKACSHVDGCIVAVNKCPDGRRKALFFPADLKLIEDVAFYMGRVLERYRSPGMPQSEHEIAGYMARLLKCEFVKIGPEFPLDGALLNTVGEENLKRYQVLPLKLLAPGKIRCAIANPNDHQCLADFEVATGLRLHEKVVATATDIRDALRRTFPERSKVMKVARELVKEYDTPLPSAALELSAGDDENSAPIVHLANRIIEDAYAQGASDIHLEPAETKVKVRYRVDGLCREKLSLPKAAHPPLVARLKIMSELDIAEHRLPQDGRIVFKKFSPQYDLDLRVSVVPANHGESVVLRILDKTKSTLPLDKLGFSHHNLQLYRSSINIPYGMVLHCGPTGSGKSMTLYAALNEINSPEYKILTVENPIEYTLPGIVQVQTKAEIGLTFAAALRCFLRQDPDIILVGEIRDRETAEIGIEAALTGHVLFSTLHTNDACSSITRLVELGIQPFLISTTLSAICSQRLLRRLCSCKTSAEPSADDLRLLCCARDSAPIGTLYQAAGCERCDFTGYKGRTGIHELLRMTDELRDLVAHNVPGEKLKLAARRGGMRTLFEDAMEKVKSGVTSVAEAMSTTVPDDGAKAQAWTGAILELPAASKEKKDRENLEAGALQ